MVNIYNSIIGDDKIPARCTRRVCLHRDRKCLHARALPRSCVKNELIGVALLSKFGAMTTHARNKFLIFPALTQCDAHEPGSAQYAQQDAIHQARAVSVSRH